MLVKGAMLMLSNVAPVYPRATLPRLEKSKSLRWAIVLLGRASYVRYAKPELASMAAVGKI